MTSAPRLQPAVFLDRDGVLNEAVIVSGRPHPPARVDDLVVDQTTVTACQQLRDAGLLLVVVTNQPDISRGTQRKEAVDAINAALCRQLALDAVFVCPHDDRDACPCRKPQPGMLLEAARTLHIDLRHSVVVGDRWRDVEAGRRAGCATVFVDRGYDEPLADAADLVVDAFPDAVPWILDQFRANKKGGTRAVTHS